MRLLKGPRLKQLIKVYTEYMIDILRLFDVLNNIPNARQNEEFQSVVAINSIYTMYI